MEVKFYDKADNDVLKFAVIISRYDNKWVFCKHRERDTYEIPGGHREHGEEITETAKRELFEETGASIFNLEPVCIYSVTGKNRLNITGEETFGMLFYAEISSFESELYNEIERVELFEEIPEKLTYPEIQPLLIKEYLRRKNGI
ncbi:MAG: NUDIX domain-containing protein [Oscillospiraceae bacterium]|nr:NUDIX domain-containing protein [Oscillospiraceae bacterium]